MADVRLHAVPGTLLEILTRRPGADEWQVRLADGTEALALVFPSLTGDLAAGQKVWLNTTAAELGLGTGGFHLVLAPLEAGVAPGTAEIGQPARREAGHLMKLRYTPLQHAVLAAEEEASPHQSAIDAVRDLDGLPVVVAELHSAAMAAAIASRACGAKRVVYVMTDEAALPLAFSRLTARLRSDGVLVAAITAGQAFGGELEAMTLASALAAARAVFSADLVVVSQGPGNAGTGTAFGFSGLAQAEHLNTVAALGGRAVAVPRISFADSRPRHQGLSHHSATVLGRMTLARVAIALPTLPACQQEALAQDIQAAGIHACHEVRLVPADRLLDSLDPYRGLLTTMGRSIDEERGFFLAPCAAARLAMEPEAGRAWPG